MNEEINAIKEKYEMLKQPLHLNLAAVANGKPVDSSLYVPEGIDKLVDFKGVTPQALPKYWSTAL
jgi:hypothetical protein